MANIDKKDAERGLYNKFVVQRTDGRDKEGEKHHGCEYFVLDLNHDPHAIPAIRIYARACESEYPKLSADLDEKAENYGYKYKDGGLQHDVRCAIENLIRYHVDLGLQADSVGEPETQKSADYHGKIEKRLKEILAEIEEMKG